MALNLDNGDFIRIKSLENNIVKISYVGARCSLGTATLSPREALEHFN